MCANITIVMYHLHFHACSAIIFYSRCYHWSYAMHALYCTVQFSIVYYYVMWCDVVVRHKVNLSCNLIPCTILDFSSGFSLLGFVYLVVRLLACLLALDKFGHSLCYLRIYGKSILLKQNGNHNIVHTYMVWWILFNLSSYSSVCVRTQN